MEAEKEYELHVKRVIPADLHMISGSMDSQVSMEASDISQFQLPKASGKSGGAQSRFSLVTNLAG